MTPPAPRPVGQRANRAPGSLRRVTMRALALGLLAATLTGCQIPSFGYPTQLPTEQSHRAYQIWQASCVAALAVGAFVLVLIIYAPVRYRKRSDELPAQVRYNLPIEVLYTVVPFVIIAALFYYTARDENYLNKVTSPSEFKANHGVTVDVIGFQWNWKFEYPQYDASVAGTADNQAVLYLPANRPVRFVEQSKDVVHSFFIPEFLIKRDVIPGRINTFEVKPERVGTYVGRCAELCGYQHDRMNFTVKVLPSEEFDRTIAQVAKARGTSSDSLVQPPGGNDSNAPNGVGNPEPRRLDDSSATPPDAQRGDQP